MTFGTTGQYCKVAGKYRCFGNADLKLTFSKNEMFPPDSNGNKAIWILLHVNCPVPMEIDRPSMKNMQLYS